MSLAQRLAWLDGVSTLAVLATAIAVWSPVTDDLAGSLWRLAARVGIVAAVCLGAFYYNDLYDFEVPHDAGQLFTRLCRALGFAALVLAGTYLLFPTAIIGGNLAPYALFVTLFAVLVLRLAVYTLAKRAPFSERVVIMGGGRLAAELAEQIATRPDLAMRVAGVLTPEGDAVAGVQRLGAYGDVPDVVLRARPDRIIVAMPDRRGNLPVSALLSCRFRGVRVEEGTEAYERFTRRLAVESLTPSGLIFGDGFRVSRAQLALKRAMRIGLGGRPFRLVKFRTMRQVERGADGIWERDNASRVTRFGAVLRRYRLDELPQCVNILKGDMSLVGPRPEMVSNVATFSAVIPFYNLRHEVRPGLTGWAQVRAGYSMSIEEVTRKLCYDLYYIKHLSLRFDLWILFDTVKFVLSGKRPG